MPILCDFTRTCENCRSKKKEKWKGQTAFRCMAEGEHKGRTVGIGRVEPYIPAWCPKRTEIDK